MSFPLNPDQQLAATTLDCPVLVTAGAGSGKTRMLTQRLINAALPDAVSGWEPAGLDEMVAITFTEKAAGELAERVRAALRAAGLTSAAQAVDSAWLSTIHGLCSRLLRRHALEAGIDPLFGVAETVHAGQLRAEAFETVAVELIAGDAAVARLFDAYGYAQLYDATVTLCRQMAVFGLSADSIACEPARTLEELTSEAVALFSDGCTACEGYSGTAMSVTDFSARCDQLLVEALDLPGTHPDADERLSALACLVGRYKPLRRGLKGLADRAEEAAERHEALTAAVGTALVAPHGPALRALAARYASAYATLKATAAVLDFDDLQLKAVELLERDEALAARYQERFRIVMIDEFQDTDALQLRLVEALSDGDLCTVGDEKQAIYRFRGADIEVYREHRARMAEVGALEVELGVNYRSHPDVLAFVNAVFSAQEYFAGELLRLVPPDTERETRSADAALGEGPRVEALFVDTHELGCKTSREGEAAALAARFAELVAGGIAPGDMAVLVRAYSNAHIYAEALGRVGIPAVIIGGSRFFGLEEVAVMRALVRAIANPADGAAVGELLVSEFCPVSDDALALMRVTADGRDWRPLWQVVGEYAGDADGTDGEALRRFTEALERARASVGTMPLGDIVLRATEDMGYDLRLLGSGNAGKDAFANVVKFARQASAFEAQNGGGPAAFSADLDAKELLGEVETPVAITDATDGAVRIMSVHASKGLEFPVVAVVDLAFGGGGRNPLVRTARYDGGLRMALRAPSTDGTESLPKSGWWQELAEDEKSAEAEEGDRVLYVAFTRAQDLLIASGSMDLQPKSGSKATHHLVRLARILGVGIPVSGTQDTEARPLDAATGVAARCRVRVIDAGAYLPDVDEGEGAGDVEPAGQDAGARGVPAQGEPFTVATTVGLAPVRTSYSALALFERCPRRYFAEVVLGMRRIEVVREGETTAMQFGSAMHAVLQLVDAHGRLPDVGRLASIARHAELDAEQKARLTAAVTRFVESPLASRVAQFERVSREAPFAIPIAAGECLLRGNIDLYARQGTRALIVDYKSGSSGTPDELAERYRLQARCYALAALVDGATEVEVVFVRPEVGEGDEQLEQVRFTFDASDETVIRAELDGLYREIATSGFAPLPKRVESECGGCAAPTGLCPNARV